MERQLQSSLGSYALALCRALATCRDLQGAVAVLQQAAATLLEGSASGIDRTAAIDAAAGAEALVAAHAALLAAATAAGPKQPPGQLLRSSFYASPAFQDVAETLLIVVAPEWLPSFSDDQKHQLFEAWFNEAPAVALLPALTRHLAAVQPSSAQTRTGRAKVTAVSADVAASMLAARFAAPGSTGMRELVQNVQRSAIEAAKAAGGASSDASDAAGRQLEGLAAALSSVPERAAAVEQPQLSPETYVPLIVQQLLRSVAEQQKGGSANHQAAATMGFAADVLARFCRRGHAQHVANALLGSLRGPAAEAEHTEAAMAAAASSLVAAMPDSLAVEKLLEVAVKEAAGTAAADAATADSTGAPLPLDAPPKTDAVACSTAKALSRLVPPAVWQARADVRMALTDKLLLQQPRRLPALSALRGLLLFLQQQAELPGGSVGAAGSAMSSNSGAAPAGSTNVLADVAARVAQLWGDASTVQRLAPPQQAYLTAALCGSLALLSRLQLERHPQLLGALLAGITTRLDSPLQAVRRQAMRVGQALSAVLDPSKPPMFIEDSDQLWQLLAEERWEPQQAQRTQHAAAAAAGAPAAGPSGGEGAGSQAAGPKLTPRQARREARRQRRMAAAARREAQQQARREREQQEVEGPLTETDSDDEWGSGSDASSISSSGSSEGSSSGGEFEQYDLEESDEEDPARSKLQLRDLPKMLLSKAEEDWRGQMRALRHAEWLIRAAPDELPQYAVPLARALIHTKVPGWLDEEMPGAAPRSANAQRFRDVVSLLVEAPEPAGLALAAEMYGPSMDVYQRAMILDGMSAAAAELAKPGSALPPLPGLHKQPPKQLTEAAAERAAAAAAAAAGLTPEQQRMLTTTAHGSRRVGTVTRIASRSLAAAARRQGAAGQATHINRFPPIALKWAAALLKHCDEPQHGIDLLGKDHFLLGKLLVTLGSFLEASSQSTEAATLAAATLELMRCGRVHNHPEPFVRRAALLAAGQVLGAVPPARLATAMLSSAAGGSPAGVALSAASAARDAADEALVSRLEWLRGWTEQVAERDSDDSCRMMADGVRKLQGNLAAGALAALGSSQPASPLESGSLLPLAGGNASGGRGGVSLPVGLPDIRLP